MRARIRRRRRKSLWPLRTEAGPGGRGDGYRRWRLVERPLCCLEWWRSPSWGGGGDPVADWESEEAGLGLGVEDRVLVQRGLVDLGYDPGEGDGLLGTGTRAALREWQLARDLEPTGYLTAATAEVLRTVGEQVVAEAERRRPGRVFRDCGTCPEMVVVPPGSYMMGSPASEAGRGVGEGPHHRVTIGYSLAVGVYEVTFAEWDACVDAWGMRGGTVPTTRAGGVGAVR